MKTTLLASLLCAGALTLHAATPEKPNIVFILTDDQGYGDLGCYGLKTAKTPNLDRLAGQGTRFTDYYSQTVCGPARSAILTGRYPTRSKGWSMPATEITFAERMKPLGYATACFGKWDVSNRKPEIDRMPNAKGFDTYWGPLGANDRGYVELWENNNALGEDKDLASLSRRYTDRAIAFVEANKEKPFLLYLCHTMMHTVIDASPEFRDRTGNGLYADTLEELDHEVGRLVDAIDRLGLGEKTLIIFTSDNGPWNNDQEKQHAKNAGSVAWSKGPETAWGDSGPLRDGKGSTYEGGMRVPMIARWTGKIPAGRVSGQIVSGIDFFPTFAALAGFEVPPDRLIDGVDQSAHLLGKTETGARDHLYYIHGGGPLAVRKGKWKYFPGGTNRGAGYAQKGSGVPELFNLEADIGETKNVAAEHPEIAAELEALFRAYQPEPGEEARSNGKGGGKSGKKSKAKSPTPDESKN